MNLLQIFAAPWGSDENPGTRELPTASPDGALRRIREMRKPGQAAQAVFAGGEYFLEKPLCLTPEDSGTAFCPLDGEKVVFTGGRRLEGWKDADDPERPGLLTADAPWLSDTRQLYVNGRRAERAGVPVKKALLRRAGEPETIRNVRGTYTVYPGYLAAGEYADPSLWNDSRVEFIYDISWVHRIIPVEGAEIRPEGTFLTMSPDVFRICQTGGMTNVDIPGWMENSYRFLKKPGQWYFDARARRMYYWPLEGEQPEAVAPCTEKLVCIAGQPDRPVRDISFSGIRFSHSTWLTPGQEGWPEQQANFALDAKEYWNGHAKNVAAPSAAEVSMAENISFTGCEFTKTGAGALAFGKGAHGCLAEGCVFRDISGSGVFVGGMNLEDAHPFTSGTIEHHTHDLRLSAADNTIRDCCLLDIGMDYKGGIGVVVGYSKHTTVSRCSISRIAYTGISVGWGWGYWDRGGRPEDAPSYPKIALDDPTISQDHVIEHNEIGYVMQKMHDGGGIYTLSDMPGMLICYNRIHDIAGWPGGIYLDEGAGGMVVYGNRTWNTQMALQINIRKDTYGHRFNKPVILENEWDIPPGNDSVPEGPSPRWKKRMPRRITAVYAPPLVRAGDRVLAEGWFGETPGRVLLDGREIPAHWTEERVEFRVPDCLTESRIFLCFPDGETLSSIECLRAAKLGETLCRAGGKEPDSLCLPEHISRTEQGFAFSMPAPGLAELTAQPETGEKWGDCSLSFSFCLDTPLSGFAGIYCSPYREVAGELPCLLAELLPALPRQVHIEELIDDVLRGAGTAQYPLETGRWYRIRAVHLHNTMAVRIWPEESPEPDGWTASGTVSMPVRDGWMVRFKATEPGQGCRVRDIEVQRLLASAAKDAL